MTDASATYGSPDRTDVRILRGVVLPRVTSAAAAELFSTGEVRPTAALEVLGDPVVAEPERPLPAWEAPRPPSARRGGRALLGAGALVGAAIVVGLLIVWFPHDEHPTQSVARPGAGTLPRVTPSGPTEATTTPGPVSTGVRERKGAAPAPTTSSPAAHRKFSVVAGPGCTGGAYARVGYYTDGRSGWLAGSQGYAAAGCDGRFDSLPMSGTTTGDDPGLWARWTFDPGSHHHCKVAVFTPDNGSRVYVGGSPAHYSVHLVSGDTAVTGFHIDQPHTLGRWVTGRSFTAPSAFYVRLDNTGKDWSGDTKTYAHVAAAQVHVVCT
ncbi:hypothetical protein [Actinomadura sp. DC4]|uniref:hypothetical protein n=1 Tax=Actinomadura sp. DC4 TaxID=3055069 RepID=UPI0025B030EC|nr:hypothetical protein [Actinomadura sp. DC4]MDN3356202.1 hypothetical protein [Actinomadura sp. DC4]